MYMHNTYNTQHTTCKMYLESGIKYSSQPRGDPASECSLAYGFAAAATL